MTPDPLYAALLKERYSSTWWVTTRTRVDRSHERTFQRALAEALVRLDRYNEEVAS